VDLRELKSVADLERCEQVQLLVWGEAVPEVNAALFRATLHAGALVAGAFEGGELLGFAFGFPSYVDAQVGFHSHLLAVLPQARGRGLGRSLKWFQRDWCLARGVTQMTWTFDPLQAKNARLNLEYLGAHARHYHPDFYGALGGALNGALPTDRVVAEWPLNAPHVAALAAGTARPGADKPPDAALTCGADGEPNARNVWAERVWLELPSHIAPQTDFAHAHRWRLALRAALQPLLDEGYTASRFIAGGYVLERPPAKNLAEAG